MNDIFSVIMYKSVLFSFAFFFGYFLIDGLYSFMNTTLSAYEEKYQKNIKIITGIVSIFVMYFCEFNINYLVYLTTFAILLVIYMYDKRFMIIPEELIIMLFFIGIVNVLNNPLEIKSLMLGFLLSGIGFFLLSFLTGGLLGGGDVKLIAILGLIFGLDSVIRIIFLSFIVGGVICVIGMATKKLKKGDFVPFGPFIIIASIITFFLTINESIFTIFTSIITNISAIFTSFIGI